MKHSTYFSLLTPLMCHQTIRKAPQKGFTTQVELKLLKNELTFNLSGSVLGYSTKTHLLLAV